MVGPVNNALIVGESPIVPGQSVADGKFCAAACCGHPLGGSVVVTRCRMVHSELQHCRWSMLGAAGIMLTSVSSHAAATVAVQSSAGFGTGGVLGLVGARGDPSSRSC